VSTRYASNSRLFFFFCSEETRFLFSSIRDSACRASRPPKRCELRLQEPELNPESWCQARDILRRELASLFFFSQFREIRRFNARLNFTSLTTDGTRSRRNAATNRLIKWIAIQRFPTNIIAKLIRDIYMKIGTLAVSEISLCGLSRIFNLAFSTRFLL